MCSCERVDFLVINSGNANALLSISETDFTINVNQFNLNVIYG